MIPTYFRIYERDVNKVEIYDSYPLHAPQPIAEVKLQPFPGSEKILVSFDLDVSKNYRENGVSKLLFNKQCLWARLKDYKVIMCTTLRENAIQAHRLDSLGWNKIDVTNTYITWKYLL